MLKLTTDRYKARAASLRQQSYLFRHGVVVQVVIVQDNEGQTGPFLEELRLQSEQEHQQYVLDVFDALDGKS